MRTTVLVLIVLILASRQTINGADPNVDWEDDDWVDPHEVLYNENVGIALKTLCKAPSDAIRKAVKCLEEDGHWIIKGGNNAIVLFVDITPQEGETEVVELTRKSDGTLKRKDKGKVKKKVKEKVRKKVRQKVEEKDKSKIKAVIKVGFGGIQPVERSNVKVLGDWMVGPKVYEIPVHDHSVPFEKYLILERIDGWTFHKLFQRWVDRLASSRGRTDHVFALTLQRKLLNMHIVYLKRVMDVWKLKYRYCDASALNIMMRFAPMEECDQIKETEGEEGVTFDVIGEDDKAKCVVWKTKYAVLVDPDSMVPLEKAEKKKYQCGWDSESREPVSVDLCRVFENWSTFKDWLKDVPLIKEMDEIIGTVDVYLPPGEEEKRGDEILKKLMDLREVEKMKMWSADHDRRVKASEAQKKLVDEAKKRAALLEALQEWKVKILAGPTASEDPKKRRVAGNTRTLVEHPLQGHVH